MLGTIVVLSFANHSETIKPNRSFDSFPMAIGGWSGIPSKFDEKIYEILGVDDSILATYQSDGGDTVQLYVGFYQSQKEGDLIHSPKNCMPGSGWNIIETSIETVPVEDSGNRRSIDVIRLKLEKGAQQQVMLYWFQSRGRIIASEYLQKILLVVDSIIRHRTDGSFVRLIAPVTTREDLTLELLKRFAKDIYPHLNEYIPS
ncbi:MAG: EpsI family protein [Desulfobacteraceae bacterium]|nr:EpsI family protein [Desulfobacteraceae bacterium]